MSEHGNGIAVVGMACIFPGAGDLDAFERNLEAGFDAIIDAPPERIPPEFYDPESDEIDRVYCRRGGFIDEYARFDPFEWGLMPVAARGSEPDQMLTLRVAGRALADAGYDDRPFPRESTGVVLGRGGYLTPRVVSLLQAVRTSHEVATSLERVLPGLDPEVVDSARREYRDKIQALGPDTIIGVVPNLAASRVANRLDLKGPAYTVDAACASSLVAVDQARLALLAGRLDMALVGGVHICNDPAFWTVFCQLGALSRNQRIRPFHREADGLLMGEGVGVVVLKRLADALRDDDRIYAVLSGSGTSSDGRASTIMAPRSESQALALERAWREARLDPRERDSIGYVEAHGTATPTGDAAEIDTLARIFGPPQEGPAPGLGSVKSMIGHTMPAAGIAGLIKAALGIHRGRLYPTLHCEDPNPALEESRFRLVTEARDWEPSHDAPRRAAVNAFGFGGINAHLILEEIRDPGYRRTTGSAAPNHEERTFLLAAEDPESLLASLEGGTRPDQTGSCRLAILDPTPERVEQAREIVRRGDPFRDRRGHIWFSPTALLQKGGGIAFLFPGMEGDLPDPIDEVAIRYGKSPLPRIDEVTELEQAGFQLIWTSLMLHKVLVDAGLRPAAVAGHSIGEWAAMYASGLIASETLDELISTLKPASLEVPGVVFAAVGQHVARVREVLDDLPDVYVSLDNCPHQCVICGPKEEIDKAFRRLKRERIFCQELPFQSGFHTPYFEDYTSEIAEVMNRLPLANAEFPLWSTTTCEPYPQQERALRNLLLEHLIRPVRFRELVDRLYEEGIRAFVQVGFGSLTGFVDDTLKGRPHMSVSAYDPRRDGLAQLRRLAASLWVEGAVFDVEHLLGPPIETVPTQSSKGELLALGAPMVYLSRPIEARVGRGHPPEESIDDPIMQRFLETMTALESSRREVLDAWLAVRSPSTEPSTFRRHLSLHDQPALVDHSFFDLPEGWPNPIDGFPVVPMTMSISMMIDAVEARFPDRIVRSIENVRAYRWLLLEAALDVELQVVPRDAGRVGVSIMDPEDESKYISCEMVTAPAYPPAPRVGVLDREGIDGPSPMTPEQMYAGRYMFHGPSYQSVAEIGAMGEKGIRGKITRLRAEGSLLDAAGQLGGLWIGLTREENQVAIPVIVNRIDLYGPEPDVGTELECVARVRYAGKRLVRFDMEIFGPDGVWAFIEGWQDRRNETAGWMWPIIRATSEKTLSAPHPFVPGCAWITEPIESASGMDYLAGRYLRAEEVEIYRELGPRRKVAWLNGRIAAKDAVRLWCWSRGAGSIYPIEILIDDENNGSPLVRYHGAPNLRISITHKGGVAAAMVAEGYDVGLDLERVEQRGEGFDEVAFGPAERKLIPTGEEADEWRARFWAAKEALSKKRGTGLGGNPRGFPVTGVDDETVIVDSIRVRTGRYGEWIFAWTVEEE